MDDHFVSYAFQDLPRKSIKKFARQYHGVDMASLIGADEDNFPFVVGTDEHTSEVMFWNTYNGIMVHLDEDPVRAFAAVSYMRENGYPIFTSIALAEQWAREHDWPRKSR